MTLMNADSRFSKLLVYFFGAGRKSYHAPTDVTHMQRSMLEKILQSHTLLLLCVRTSAARIPWAAWTLCRVALWIR